MYGGRRRGRWPALSTKTVPPVESRFWKQEWDSQGRRSAETAIWLKELDQRGSSGRIIQARNSSVIDLTHPMAVLKTRNRLVNFRMTQDELDSLKMACLVKGSRNISDFARAAVLESIESQTESGMLIHSRLSSLDAKVTEVGVAVQFLAELLKGTLRGRVPASHRDPNPAAGPADCIAPQVVNE